jgi:general secretion pathway protein I
LIEVLVAFAILAIALGVLLNIFSSGLRNASLSDAYSRAILHAESLLAQTGAGTPISPGEEGESLDEKYHWRRVVQAYPWDSGDLKGAGPQVLPYKVTVEVFWEEGRKRRSVSLTSLRLLSQSDESGAVE